MQPIISVKGLGKKYGFSGGPGSLREAFAGVMGESPRHRGSSSRNEFWALRDVNFTVGSGETVVLMGRNGSGKSTLLKILSRITDPTEGEVDLYGRVGSLLEVGTGFHPDLTGRENVFLNGVMLGMSRHEVGKKFEDIAEFSQIGDFLDTPVKYYSSGMYLRLAFSAAVHFEPEILILDEVMAVGDAEFQDRCLAKMEQIRAGGSTILIATHDLMSARRFCDRALMIEAGRLEAFDSVDAALEAYARVVERTER